MEGTTLSDANSANQALIWVSGDRLREKTQATHKLLSDKLGTLHSRLQRHKAEDLTSYESWFSQNFSTQITKMRALHARSEALANSIEAVEHILAQTLTSPEKAYGLVCACDAVWSHWIDLGLATPKSDASCGYCVSAKNARKFKHDFINECFKRSGRCDPSVVEGEADYVRQMHDFARAEKDEIDAAFHYFMLSHGEAPEKPLDSSSSCDQFESHQQIEPHDATPKVRGQHCKDLYHELARKLHPDLNPDLSDKERQLWHLVQSAYESNNYAQLLDIYTLHRTDGNLSSATVSIGELQKQNGQLKDRVAAMKKKVRQCKKDVHWNFEERLGDSVFVRSISSEIKRELGKQEKSAQAIVQKLQAIVAGFSNTKKRRR